jgi:serine/threonine-protein kinase RsbW
MAQTDTLAPKLRTSREPFAELRQSFPSQLDAVSPSVAQVMRFIATVRSPDGSEADIETALHEAICNAVVHGNAEDPDKGIYVSCRCSIDGEISITVRDEGQGFDSRAVPDPTTSENRLLAHGRGIYLMRALMDEVSFEEGGRVVSMRKKPNATRTSPL